jgi:molybdenum cofactor cytidylyltransferase
MNVGIIVLAAGASTRMGEPKQLLRYRGATLLRRAVDAALGTGCDPVVVVLGADAERARAEVSDTAAVVVVNESWAEGMGSSIRVGVAALDDARAALVTLCDNPLVTSSVLGRLVDAYLAERSLLVASEYESGGARVRGVPALFDRDLFPELSSLRGSEGARRIVERNASRATFVSVPEAAFDVDTPEDFAALGDASPDGP